VLTATVVEIDLADLNESFTLPEVTTCPHEQHKGKGEEGLEEALSIGDATARGNDGGDKLSNQGNDAERQTNPGSPDTKDVPEWDLVEAASSVGPCGPESNVALVIVSFPSSIKVVYHLPHRWSPR
jgi:hypothetical protein